MSGESISSIGNYGLNGYGSYYDPTAYAMMSGYGGYGMTNPAMINGYSSMMMNPAMMNYGGMYGGAFMKNQMEMLKEYTKWQEELEQQKLDHATAMHKKQQMAEVQNLSSHDQTFFLKAMEDGYVQQGIREIYDAIRSGNQDYVVQKFFDLKQGILTKYSDYFNSSEGTKNSQENINNFIRLLYAEIGGGFQPGAGKPDLINDIKAYGESPFQHGFNSRWLGNHGHNKMNAEQALNQMFGTGMNDKGSKKNAERIGAGLSMLTEGVAGGAAGAAALTAGMGIVKGFVPKKMDFGFFKNLPGALKLGFVLGALGDAWWQYTRS